MKRLFASLIMAGVAFAATQGSITTTKDGDASHTTVKVSSLTSGALVFVVTVHYQATITGLDSYSVQTIARPGGSTPFDAPAVMAVFDVPLSRVTSVGVAQYVESETQSFQ